MRFCKWILAVFFATLAGLASGATYTFTGVPYTSVKGVFTTDMFISGSFTTASALPANMPLTTIGPGGANPLVTSWSFSDGVHTYTNTDSQVLYGEAGYFTIGTNASGGISNYLIAFMAPTGAHTVGQVMNGMGFTNQSEVEFDAAVVGVCASVTDAVCKGITQGTGDAVGGSRGVWSLDDSGHPVPATSSTMLVLMAVGLGWLAFRQRRLLR